MANEELRYAGLDFQSTERIINLPQANANGQPVVLEQLNAVIEGLAPKDNVRVSTQGNLNLVSPGANIDGIAMVVGDRVLVRSQATQTENGIYIWNGAAVPATRAPDASTFDELESANVSVDEGTDAGKRFRQTQVNGVIGTNNVIWASMDVGASQATETASGIAEIATQAETDAGADDLRFITPLKAKSASWAKKKYPQNFGDGSTTQFDITHNLNTEDVIVSIREAAGLKRGVGAAWRVIDANTVRVNASPAPASNALRIIVIG